MGDASGFGDHLTFESCQDFGVAKSLLENIDCRLGQRGLVKTVERRLLTGENVLLFRALSEENLSVSLKAHIASLTWSQKLANLAS